ncbi:MAG: hypothetical protein V1495_08470 [Pseudomonadota bacterium]
MNYDLNLDERGTTYLEIGPKESRPIPAADLEALTFFDLVYRTLCAVMFNFSSSGHPGGSISSGRIVQSLLFRQMLYKMSDPDERTADILSYAAGHKALGMYAMYACRNEIVRITQPAVLPGVLQQMRLEDLLGFRRNPITRTPLFRKYSAKALDGHPTPQTPFVWLSTGPSGVGFTASVGLALALKDLHGDSSPIVHTLEGEGGMTPGRVSEGSSAAASAGLNNFLVHLDWNESSIDSDSVTREGSNPGDYVQWNPVEYFLVHGFNVIHVEDGFDFSQIDTAQRRGLELTGTQPTAIVYRTIKGWRYGIEGRKSHGAGHQFGSPKYDKALEPFEKELALTFPRFEGEKSPDRIEQTYFDSLLLIRKAFETKPTLTRRLGEMLSEREQVLGKTPRPVRPNPPRLELLDSNDRVSPDRRPPSCRYPFGSTQTLRGALTDTLNFLNRETGGGILATSADVYGSTNTFEIGAGFGSGFWHSKRNPTSRIFAAGGITEDAIGGICSGIAAIGGHISVGASYGAFLAPLNVISARTHAIGQQARKHRIPEAANRTFVMLCGHTGIKTGEDGPTHADPQTLAILQNNYPLGSLITLTPWDPHDLWPLFVAALQQKPPVLVPFVTRPGEKIFDRGALGLALPEASVKGVYKLLAANGKPEGVVVYQGSDVVNVFVEGVLPHLRKNGMNLDVYYIASSELFELLSPEERESIYPYEAAGRAMMISGFTRPTTYRWITSRLGRDATLFPFRNRHYLGSGIGEKCIEEAGLDAPTQIDAISRFVRS